MMADVSLDDAAFLLDSVGPFEGSRELSQRVTDFRAFFRGHMKVIRQNYSKILRGHLRDSWNILNH